MFTMPGLNKLGASDVVLAGGIMAFRIADRQLLTAAKYHS